MRFLTRITCILTPRTANFVIVDVQMVHIAFCFEVECKFEADQDLEGRPRFISDAFVSEPLIGQDIYISNQKHCLLSSFYTSAVAELLLNLFFVCMTDRRTGAHL